MFGNAGVEHMEKYGTTQEQIAKIAWKNHKHSKNNPYAQFRDEYSMEQILKSPQVFGPLTKLQCCPTVSAKNLIAFMYAQWIIYRIYTYFGKPRWSVTKIWQFFKFNTVTLSTQ